MFSSKQLGGSLMSGSKTYFYPPLWHRLFGVWFRHMRVYTQNIFSNGLPPFLEPLLFLAGVGLGLGKYITQSMEGLGYIEFLGTGLLMTSAMFTSSFECTFGTFIRLEFEKVYDGMLAAPITANNLIIGEMLWAGTKGLFFSFAVLCILALFGIVSLPKSLLAPVVGFFTGLMFSALALLVTSFVKTINHFNFYFTGFISPMFFFSGVVFPISNLPAYVRPIAEIIPLTHSVRLVRAVCVHQYPPHLLLDLFYIVVFTLLVGFFAVKRLKKRLVF
jgi:lipooligosaccharide transport system permease protein